MLTFEGKLGEFMADTILEISCEGGLSAGKTTAALTKVLRSLMAFPGIEWFSCRYSSTDTDTKLRPAFEKICASEFPDEMPTWDAKQLAYNFPNGSRCYMFGVKSADALSRYSKLRGLGVAGIYVDQSEELPADISLELRARLRQPNYPHQLIFTPNPMNVDSWQAKQFPEDNHIKGRRLYQIALYDNEKNLPADMITSLEAAYPPEHGKYASVILGKRGLNIMGDPIYEAAFQRKVHVRPIAYDGDVLLLEAFDFGKTNPAWVCAQQRYTGGISYLGGILGQNLFLEDFLPIVRKYRTEWFPALTKAGVKTCATMSQSLVARAGAKFTGLNILREAGFPAQWRDNGNSPDVVIAIIERLAAYMRRRTLTGEESLGVNDNPQRWLRASREGIEPCPFIAQAFEAGYVVDAHTISVANNEVRQPRADGWFEHGMRCCEAIELHFCADQPTPEQRDQRTMKARQQQDTGGAMPSGPGSWMAW